MKMTIAKNQVTFEGAEIGFKNFEGKEGVYNKAGDRSLSIFLSDDQATQLEDAGWNIKWPKDRPDINAEEDTRNPYLTVSIGFDFYPARLYMVASKENAEPNEASITLLGEGEVGMLDWAELENVDLVIRPYNWTVNGKSGIKAYLKSGYFKLITDELVNKYGL